MGVLMFCFKYFGIILSNSKIDVSIFRRGISQYTYKWQTQQTTDTIVKENIFNIV